MRTVATHTSLNNVLLLTGTLTSDTTLAPPTLNSGWPTHANSGQSYFTQQRSIANRYVHKWYSSPSTHTNFTFDLRMRKVATPTSLNNVVDISWRRTTDYDRRCGRKFWTLCIFYWVKVFLICFSFFSFSDLCPEAFVVHAYGSGKLQAKSHVAGPWHSLGIPPGGRYLRWGQTTWSF